MGVFNARFGLRVPYAYYPPIGGFIFGSFGRLPIVGDRVTAGGGVFVVREMAGRRIETVAAERR
jgi:CBS domain containing-hemolysin-like protein